MPRLRAIIPGVAAVALFAAGVSFAVMSRETNVGPSLIRIGTNVWPGYEPLYLARDRGLFGDLNVHFVEYTSATDVLEAYRNDAIDVAALTLDEVIRLAANGAQPRIVLTTDLSEGADALVARSSTHDVRALVGKRVGVETSALGAYLLSRALGSAGLTTADVIVVPMTVDEHRTAFLSGTVEAVVTFEPVLSELLAEDARVVFSSADIPGEVGDVLIARESFLADHKREIEQLREGFFAAAQLLDEQPAEAAAAMAPREHVSPKQFLESLQGLRITGRDANTRLFSGRRPPLVVTLERLGRVMLAEDLIPRVVDPQRLLGWRPQIDGSRA